MPAALLVTRPEPDAGLTAARLEALDIEPVLAPLLAARPGGAALPRGAFAAIAVTSANAIRMLARAGPIGALTGLPLYAVGEQTAAIARRHGFRAVSSAGGTLADLAHLLTAERPAGPILYLAAHHRSGDLAGLLAPAGLAVTTHVVYEMVAADHLPEAVARRLVDGSIAGALFYSRRTAEIFAALLDGPAFDGTRRDLECLCIAEAVAEPLLGSHFVRISLADQPSGEAMMTLALAFAREQITA